VRDDLRDPWRQRAQSLVVGRLFGQVREQMPEPIAGNREEPPVVGDAQKHLRDRQADELAVGDLRWPPGPGTRRQAEQEVVDPYVKCDDEGVEVGEHTASVVDVAIATPTFGALVMTPRSESTI
jgi:hypothetical protein